MVGNGQPGAEAIGDPDAELTAEYNPAVDIF
jgi:hypothetical protein